MYERIGYKKTFLKQVIIRVDFAAPVPSLGTSLPEGIANEAVSRFPISEPRQAVAQELQLSADGIQPKTRAKFTEWNFYGENREKRLAVSPRSILATYNQYTTYENLKDDFFAVLASLFETCPDLRVTRLGLRYINNIEIPIANPMEWDQYVDTRLLGLFSRFTDRAQVTRLFHIVGLKFHDVHLKFQFGLPNRGFPAAIREPLFVLDLDGYVHDLQELSDISSNADLAHERIQALFEESITERLREKMNA